MTAWVGIEWQNNVTRKHINGVQGGGGGGKGGQGRASSFRAVSEAYEDS